MRSKYKLKDVVKAFSSSRTFARGYAKTAEVDKALRKLSSKVTAEDAETLSGHWDRDSEGAVDFHAFAVWLYAGAEMDDLTARFANQVRRALPYPGPYLGPYLAPIYPYLAPIYPYLAPVLSVPHL